MDQPAGQPLTEEETLVIAVSQMAIDLSNKGYIVRLYPPCVLYMAGQHQIEVKVEWVDKGNNTSSANITMGGLVDANKYFQSLPSANVIQLLRR